MEGHLESLVDYIVPAVHEAKEAGNESELLDNSIDNNIMVVGARYHLDSGEVEVFG